jgi:hypothetical protein
LPSPRKSGEANGVEIRAISETTTPAAAQRAIAVRATAKRASPWRSAAKRKSALTRPSCATVAPTATSATTWPTFETSPGPRWRA